LAVADTREVDANEILVLVNRIGKTIPVDLVDDFGDQVVLYPELVRAVAARTGETEEKVRNGYKGIRYEVLGEGRCFSNPYSYKRIKMRTTLIGQNEIGVLIRRFGKPLTLPKTVVLLAVARRLTRWSAQTDTNHDEIGRLRWNRVDRSGRVAG
jgi:hypothetical protein